MFGGLVAQAAMAGRNRARTRRRIMEGPNHARKAALMLQVAVGLVCPSQRAPAGIVRAVKYASASSSGGLKGDRSRIANARSRNSNPVSLRLRVSSEAGARTIHFRRRLARRRRGTEETPVNLRSAEPRRPTTPFNHPCYSTCSKTYLDSRFAPLG